MPSKSLLLTIDVEDWFQVENLRRAIPIDCWDRCDLRLDHGIDLILSILNDCGAKATFFVLGWIAQKRPDLVKIIAREGHEIASHGFWHELVNHQDIRDFRKDVRDAKNLLEDIIGDKVLGYRAPSFTINDTALQTLAEEGYCYDSSLCRTILNPKYGSLDTTGVSQNGGVLKFPNGFIEIPICTFNFAGISIPAGGAYFRLLPLSIFKLGMNTSSQGLAFYLHPWELDSDQPRVQNIGFLNKCKHYLNLHSTMKKLAAIAKRCRSVRIKDYLWHNGFLEGFDPDKGE